MRRDVVPGEGSPDAVAQGPGLSAGADADALVGLALTPGIESHDLQLDEITAPWLAGEGEDVVFHLRAVRFQRGLT